ncbi:MAG TPA: hypothetical protein PK156_41720, partial [Polyangium sp.]|nr:hypothetical protein [Polyangium sp.]
MTTSRSLRNAVAFTILGILGMVWGVMMGLVGWPMIWFGLAMLTVGANYALPQHLAIFRKVHGKLGFGRKLFLLPYMVLLYGTWHLLRITSSEAPFVELTRGIFIGRRLLPGEYPPVATLVDLTAELDEHVPTSANLLAFPILDGAPADPSLLHEMARKIGMSPRPVYLHCAQGHGRTSMVAAAMLLELSLAQSVEDALEMIKMVRPGAKPNVLQRQALMAAFPGGVMQAVNDPPTP